MTGIVTDLGRDLSVTSVCSLAPPVSQIPGGV